jgi:hypothetical protein
MNLFNIIKELETADPEIHERVSLRRDAIKNITAFGSKIAVAALPFAFATLFKKAYGATPLPAVNDVLNFALKLEYLEAYFYNTGLAVPGLVPDSGYIQTIRNDENAHVGQLAQLLGDAAIAAPAFDLTAKGAFPDVLSNYDTFLLVANMLEDIHVRAYIGQATNLLGNQQMLNTAFAIQVVESRHAAAIRQLRKLRGANIEPWITGTQNLANDTGEAAFNASYAGENNVVQNDIDITTLASAYGTTTPYAIATQAFDEPLTKDAVLAVVAPFFV